MSKKSEVFLMLIGIYLFSLAACANRTEPASVPTLVINQATPETQQIILASETPLPETATATNPPPSAVPTATSLPPTIPPAKESLPTSIGPMPIENITVETKLGFHTEQAAGEKKYVVILADFPDVQRQISIERLSDRMLEFLNRYFSQVSYNQLKWQASLTRRYTLPYPVSYYKISPRNLDVDKSKVLALVQDAINAADDEVTFSEDLYIMIALGATNEDYGMVGYSAVPGMLNFKNDSVLTSKSGEVIKNAVVFCENAHPGTYVHDTLHILGGVVDEIRVTPCLYDHDLQAKYFTAEDWPKILIHMGYWDPLSSHFSFKRDLPPSGLSSWTKMRLGWIDPAKIKLVYPGETANVLLDPLGSEDPTTAVIKIPITENTYYLIENRQQVSFDENLPSSGVLILLADDSIYECRHGEAPVKIMDADPLVPLMNNAAYDIGKNRIFIDRENRVAIILQNKVGLSYEILITTPDQVPTQ